MSAVSRAKGSRICRPLPQLTALTGITDNKKRQPSSWDVGARTLKAAFLSQPYAHPFSV